MFFERFNGCKIHRFDPKCLKERNFLDNCIINHHGKNQTSSTDCVEKMVSQRCKIFKWRKSRLKFSLYLIMYCQCESRFIMDFSVLDSSEVKSHQVHLISLYLNTLSQQHISSDYTTYKIKDMIGHITLIRHNYNSVSH